MHIPPALLGAGIQALAIAYQQLAARLNRQLEPMGLNMTQMSLLTHMAQRNDPQTIVALAQTLQMNQPAVTKALQAMETQGWVDKQKSATDGRSSFVAISPQGQAQLQLAQQACLPVLLEAFKHFSGDDLQGLIAQLKQIELGR
jgi:DNA-binding MarR family transcriptional regulator